MYIDILLSKTCGGHHVKGGVSQNFGSSRDSFEGINMLLTQKYPTAAAKNAEFREILETLETVLRV